MMTNLLIICGIWNWIGSRSWSKVLLVCTLSTSICHECEYYTNKMSPTTSPHLMACWASTLQRRRWGGGFMRGLNIMVIIDDIYGDVVILIIGSCCACSV